MAAKEEEKEISTEMSAKMDLREARKQLIVFENMYAKGNAAPEQVDFIRERIQYWGDQVAFFQDIVYGK